MQFDRRALAFSLAVALAAAACGGSAATPASMIATWAACLNAEAAGAVARTIAVRISDAATAVRRRLGSRRRCPVLSESVRTLVLPP